MGMSKEYGKNNIARKNYPVFATIFYIVIFYLSILNPTSTNGQLAGVEGVIIQWGLLSALIVVAMIFFAKIDVKLLFLTIIILVYMAIITVISSIFNPSAEFSVARLAPILCFLMVSILIINTPISITCVKITIHAFMAIFIIWNSLIIIDNEWIKLFTINNYSQLYESATSNMFTKSRPVMSFGIYTFATYFYFMFFMIIRRLFQKTNNKIYLIYLVLLLAATVLLVSNTTFVFSCVMLAYLFFTVKKKSYKVLITIVALVSIYYIVTSDTFSAYYLESFNSNYNGVKGRYFEGGSLSSSRAYLQDNFYIGFNIIRNVDLKYTDSGYFVFYLMGGILLVLGMYYNLYKFLKNNLPSAWKSFLVFILMFEIALPYTIYYKCIYFFLFLIMSYRAIDSHYSKQQTN